MERPEESNGGETAAPVRRDFIRSRIDEDLASGRHRQVVTRFPPEPNGYLHIGHAKAICLNFTVAQEFGGRCHLRFDDTNPTKEEQEFVDNIEADIRWLGFEWGDHLYFASDYFERLYGFAVELIEKDKAYVDELDAEQMREYRGTLTSPGRESPYRNRPVAESLDLFRRMRAGDFPDGALVLRAKIDMASPNINLRDPVLYRIRRAHHHRTGDDWCIYPMYDYTHPLSDAIEGITHSLCTLEFEDHRPLYDWVLDNVTIDCHPQQIEFARLGLPYTVMSKRKLIDLVTGRHVRGWDDPRMPTLAGYRRRGYTPAAIRAFAEAIGVAKANSEVEVGLLEHHLREDLNQHAPRVMAVLAPLKVVLTNYPAGKVEEVEAINNPEKESDGSRRIPFSGELYIEREDFAEEPPKGWFRLSPGKEVRLKHGYYVRCDEVIKDAAGEITELRCTYDPESAGGTTPDRRKVKGTLHWVSASHAIPAEVRIYESLFAEAHPGERTGDYLDDLNPDSLRVLADARVEPSLAGAGAGSVFQFLRQGYFCVDPDSTPERPIFNRTVGLKDTWAKLQKRS
ncbi:MAG: glutamine--tRNA ligase/YqeY domain fusion protein [Candidatus Eisenbacteria bacterium]|uniref:Glutamine--tRNA ligase n=1 Tax=Eiseniibacteriota bacterium TaxID=2212470 RepID=A0A956RQB9_UNCEI|nr:glutamine--tRNA ligase/YqeY domain fusion protein [Candidatus Eisenbacteria bacterium]